jgi:hypothetical protein
MIRLLSMKIIYEKYSKILDLFIKFQSSKDIRISYSTFKSFRIWRNRFAKYSYSSGSRKATLMNYINLDNKSKS